MPKLGKYRQLLDSVFFLYDSEDSAKNGKPIGGTGFLVHTPSKRWPEIYYHFYGVTNWHNACHLGFSVIRLNLADGGHDIFNIEPHEWMFEPKGHDIALIPLTLRPQHRATAIGPGFLLRDWQFPSLDIGPGDDVFMLGRFIDYDGVGTNSPALRFGHISMMDAPIQQPNGSRKKSIVVDMHSRTGFSGSPVFIYRTLGSHFFTIPDGQVISNTGNSMHLLGIHWGQFPERWELKQESKSTAIDSASLITDGAYVTGLSGMTCVCPSTAILDMLNSKKLVQMREEAEVRFETEGTLEMTALGSPESAASPHGKEPTT